MFFKPSLSLMKKQIISLIDFVINMWEKIQWFLRLFQKRYTIYVSFDSQWGNEDDQVYMHVRKVIKANFKDGLLSIDIPKIEPKIPEKKLVKIS